jgi:hypothetical protein
MRYKLFQNLSWLPNDCAIDLRLLTSGNPILSNEQNEIIFKHVLFYLLNYAKRIRHKLNKLMKFSPTYNKLQHYLIEHACMYINISYINMCRLKFTVHKNKSAETLTIDQMIHSGANILGVYKKTNSDPIQHKNILPHNMSWLNCKIAHFVMISSLFPSNNMYFMIAKYINMCRLKFTVHKNKCNAIIVKPKILLPQPYVTLVKFGYPVKALWFDGSQ